MKLIVDGKEVQFDNQVKVIYEDEFVGMDDRDREVYGQLHVTLTHEGLIADLFEEDNDTQECDRTMCMETNDLIEQCI